MRKHRAQKKLQKVHICRNRQPIKLNGSINFFLASETVLNYNKLSGLGVQLFFIRTILARPKIDPIVWTESDSRQFSADTSRQSQLDGIRQTQGQRRLQQNVPGRQATGRRGNFQPGHRGAPSMRGIQGQSQPIPRIGGQGQEAFGQQQQPQFMQQRQVPSLMGRGTGGFSRGQRSRGHGGPFRDGH